MNSMYLKAGMKPHSPPERSKRKKTQNTFIQLSFDLCISPLPHLQWLQWGQCVYHGTRVWKLASSNRTFPLWINGRFLTSICERGDKTVLWISEIFLSPCTDFHNTTESTFERAETSQTFSAGFQHCPLNTEMSLDLLITRTHPCSSIVWHVHDDKNWYT